MAETMKRVIESVENENNRVHFWLKRETFNALIEEANDVMMNEDNHIELSFTEFDFEMSVIRGILHFEKNTTAVQLLVIINNQGDLIYEDSESKEVIVL